MLSVLRNIRTRARLFKAGARAFAVVVGLSLNGCGVVYYAGMPLVYEKAASDLVTEYADEVYFDGPDEADDKTRLDLFIPEGEGWPLVVFAHGGGWSDGDKDLRIGGRDVYRNIGRYLATNGVGAAVINYRLMPGVHWRTQMTDVARAVVYARRRADEVGGNPARLFVAGHSAGAHLVARVALDGQILEATGSQSGIICGVIAVAGAGYDMEDQQSYLLGAEFEYLEQRFGRVDGGGSWPREASVVQFIDDDAPPFLVIHGDREYPGLIRQSDILVALLKESGVPVDKLVVDGFNHTRMVLAMSRDDRMAGPAMVDFAKTTPCGTR